MSTVMMDMAPFQEGLKLLGTIPKSRRMIGMSIHKRLRDWRDAAIRRPAFRPVYAHALIVAHMGGHMIADDHPAWAKIEIALAEARQGDAQALDRLERELLRLRKDS